MEQKYLQAQSDFVSIQNRINQIYSKGRELLLTIADTLQSPPYRSLITVNEIYPSSHSIAFTMLGGFFMICVETSFDESLNLTDGFLTTYYKREAFGGSKPIEELIFSMPFDRIGNIANQFTRDDFAIPYLMYLVSAYKKRIAELYKERQYTLILK